MNIEGDFQLLCVLGVFWIEHRDGNANPARYFRSSSQSDAADGRASVWPTSGCFWGGGVCGDGWGSACRRLADVRSVIIFRSLFSDASYRMVTRSGPNRGPATKRGPSAWSRSVCSARTAGPGADGPPLVARPTPCPPRSGPDRLCDRSGPPSIFGPDRTTSLLKSLFEQNQLCIQGVGGGVPQNFLQFTKGQLCWKNIRFL